MLIIRLGTSMRDDRKTVKEQWNEYGKLMLSLVCQTVYAAIIFDIADGIEEIPSDLRYRIRINGMFIVNVLFSRFS